MDSDKLELILKKIIKEWQTLGEVSQETRDELLIEIHSETETMCRLIMATKQYQAYKNSIGIYIPEEIFVISLIRFVNMLLRSPLEMTEKLSGKNGFSPNLMRHYIVGIGRNVCKDEISRHKYQTVSINPEIDILPSEDIFYDKVITTEIVEYFCKNRKGHEEFYYRYVEGKSDQEIAEEREITKGNVRTRIYRSMIEFLVLIGKTKKTKEVEEKKKKRGFQLPSPKFKNGIKIEITYIYIEWDMYDELRVEVDQFEVQWADNQDFNDMKTEKTTSYGIRIKNLNPGTVYYFRVRCMKSKKAVSDFSPTTKVTTLK